MHPIGSNGATRSVVDGRALAHVLALHPDPVATVDLGSPYGPTVRARRRMPRRASTGLRAPWLWRAGCD
ncbi:hypothetical protein ACFQ6Q_36530 [Streptomyces sp. NPDC056437]|uniref:hypothetical protein n=1 Tax=Streptomyces sp. NPDC056437 TaxID=3345816 RepID=UPI0036C8AF20